MKRKFIFEVDTDEFPAWDNTMYLLVPMDKTEELIECKDCKHNDKGLCSWHHSSNYNWVVDDHDHCSVGERVEE